VVLVVVVVVLVVVVVELVVVIEVVVFGCVLFWLGLTYTVVLLYTFLPVESRIVTASAA